MAQYGDEKQSGPLSDGLRAWRDKPEGPIVPIATNWTVIPANDNVAPEDVAGLRVNRRWATRPTMGEIEEAIASGIEVRNERGQIIRIGSLHFSDGSQTEKAYTHGPDGKLISYSAILPVGAMLNTKDAQERMLGGDATQTSNAPYTAVYKARYPGVVRRKARTKPECEPLTKAQLRAAVKDATESYEKPVKIYKTGFPWKPASLRELFSGFEKSPKGETGSIAWQDISGHIVAREAWLNTMAAISDDDKTTLDAAVSARTLKDVAPGKRGGNAYRIAHARLRAANDNLVLALKKNAA